MCRSFDLKDNQTTQIARLCQARGSGAETTQREFDYDVSDSHEEFSCCNGAHKA